jgi:phosphatidylcholine synthase
MSATFGLGRHLAAWAVHAYTACGVVIAFVALRAIDEGRVADAFRWLGVAMAIDASDGTLARAVKVKQVVPWFDGTRLDDIVDYLTYVLVPVVMMHEAGLIGAEVAVAPLFASAYGFCRTDAKASEGEFYFRGFPSYWNVLAFYVWILGLSPATTTALVLVLALLVFAPLKFVYPSRTVPFRPVTIGLGTIWALVMIVVVWMAPETPRALVLASLAYPAYYFALSFWLQATRS